MSKRYVPPAELCVFRVVYYMGTKRVAIFGRLPLYKYEERDDYQIFAIELETPEEKEEDHG